MARARRVCGKSKYHAMLGLGEEHGQWVAGDVTDKTLCRAEAVPAVSRDGVRWKCDECGEIGPERSQARSHWFRVHAPLPRSKAPIAHGTDAGYFAHRRRGETACAECKAAHSVAAGRWRQGWARRWDSL